MRDNKQNFAFPPDQQETQRPSYTRPTDLVKLPSKGYFYPEDHPLHNQEDIEVGYMTTKEEDILMSPTLNERGLVFDKLIESVAIRTIKASSLLPGDKNAILINARKNAYGDNYEVIVTCQSCDQESNLQIDLSQVENKDLENKGVEFTGRGTFIISLPKTKSTVEIKMLNAEDEADIRKKAEQKAKHNLLEAAVTDRLRQMVVSVNGETDMLMINDFISNLPIADSREIQLKYIDIMPDIDFTYSHECDCGHENKGGVPILGTFFWPDE